MIGPTLVGDDLNTANDAKMDTVESLDGKQTDDISCTSSLKSNQTQSEISTFSNWRIPGQTVKPIIPRRCKSITIITLMTLRSKPPPDN